MLYFWHEAYFAIRSSWPPPLLQYAAAGRYFSNLLLFFGSIFKLFFLVLKPDFALSRRFDSCFLKKEKTGSVTLTRFDKNRASFRYLMIPTSCLADA